MNVLAVARNILAAVALATLGVMAVASAPWSGIPPGELMTKLLLFPFIAAWALAPYFVAHKFALQSAGAEGWLLIAAIPVAAAPVLWIYLDAMVFAERPDPQAAIVFVIFPVYQSLFVLAVWGATRALRRYFLQ
jgi:hypothetical protein